MNLSFLLQYAIPALISTIVLAILSALEIPESIKFTLYGISLVGTFVLKAYIDKKFKEGEVQKAEDDAKEKEREHSELIIKLEGEIRSKDKKISNVNSRIEMLENELRMLKIEHVQELHQLERSMSKQLNTNAKCIENANLWGGVESVLIQISKMSDKSLEKSKQTSLTNRKVNRGGY